MENNMGEVAGMVSNLRNMAVDMGNEIESQNRQLDRINNKVNCRGHFTLVYLDVLLTFICFFHDIVNHMQTRQVFIYITSFLLNYSNTPPLLPLTYTFFFQSMIFLKISFLYVSENTEKKCVFFLFTLLLNKFTFTFRIHFYFLNML